MLKTILLVVLFWLLPQAYSYSEETSNLVTPADEWTQSGKVSTTQCSYSGTLEDGKSAQDQRILVVLLMVEAQ